MNDPKKMYLMVAGAIVVVAIALLFIFRTASAPQETISTTPVVPKGIDAPSNGKGAPERP